MRPFGDDRHGLRGGDEAVRRLASFLLAARFFLGGAASVTAGTTNSRRAGGRRAVAQLPARGEGEEHSGRGRQWPIEPSQRAAVSATSLVGPTIVCTARTDRGPDAGVCRE